jgi:hypothetical protein
MRYILSFLLIFSFAFAQKTTTITEKVDGEKKIEVKVRLLDEKVLYTITEDGKTEELEAALDDDKALEKIHEKLESYGIDEKVKLKICKKVKAHDCKVKGCDPNTCDLAGKKDAMVSHMKDKGDIKKHKIIKKHKMMDEPFLIDEKAGFLGVQIQDLSEQLSDYFKLKGGNGVLVSEVVKDSPAEKAGLKAGDIVTKVDDNDIENSGDLTMTIRGYEPESKVSISVIRNGKKKKLKATLGETESGFHYKFGELDELRHLDDTHEMIIKMLPEGLEDFELQKFTFDEEKFKQQMEEMRKELEVLKEEMKKLRKEK